MASGRYTLVVTGDPYSDDAKAKQFHIAKWTQPKTAIGEPYWHVIATVPTKAAAGELLADLGHADESA